MRIVHEVKDSVFTFTGLKGSTGGLIDTQGDVGGWPMLNSLPPPVDTDKDGMPDAWESSMGLNPNDASDRNTISPSGYTYLEVYLNSPGLLQTTNVNEDTNTPTTFSLSQNYPNPFNPVTRMEFTVKKSGSTTLIIYNTLGQRLTILFEGYAMEGRIYHQDFNAQGLSSGLYVARLENSGASQIRKLLLLK